MFDPSTESLIRNAPALEGLDLQGLPKEFTRIFASIVASRMRLRGLLSVPAGQILNDSGQTASEYIWQTVEKEISFLSGLASTQEALISVAPHRHDREAAAFVAGTAHYVLLQANQLISDSDISQSLEIDMVPAAVSATLLFLIAGASADAAEMSQELESAVPAGQGTRSKLLADIRRFAVGQLTVIKEPDSFVADADDDTSAEVACSGLYHLIHKALYKFARVMLGEADNAQIEQEFAKIESLSMQAVPSGQGFSSYSLFAGPRHLAALFRSLAKDFPAGSVANIPPPFGVEPDRWRDGVKSISRRRPYLWRNHLDAIRNGYLDVGVSSAISFPTGAGKSTLSELKILATLSSKLDVVFLAPTLALVDQTARALDGAFPDAKIERELASDDPFGLEESRLPPITVMTPERCLMLMGFEPALFRNVGLIVFDECHLLHAITPERGKRAVDSMLCVLNALQFAPKADMLLLSAMMSNADEIAGWIQSALNRKCLSLTMNWKPTRQVRGCLVFAASELKALKSEVALAKIIGTTATPPKVLREKMYAHPQGFFGLKQTWDTLQREDYALVPLLERPVLLALNDYWRLTPNANQVASEVAAAVIGSASERKLKTLIFCQTTVNANSTAKSARERIGKYSITLTPKELALYELALEELGSPEALFVEFSKHNRVTSSALSHHGRLLPCERHLHESLFQRKDGIHVLAATSTLAQGMNLPSQIVLIAGDSRFDESANQLERLEAHELLNAAGRAGRAGQSSYGFVLVIPSKVIHFSDSDGLIHDHWTGLQAIFAQSDQCLHIEDPLAAILDHIHLRGSETTEVDEYLLRRLPVGISDAEVDAPAKLLLSRTLKAYLRRRENNENWITSRIASVLQARKALVGAQQVADWADRLGAKFGIEPSILRSLHLHFNLSPSEDSVNGWINWLFEWLQSHPGLFSRLVRQDGLEALFGTPYRKLQDDVARGLYALPRLEPLLRMWITGHTLQQIECTYGTALSKTKKCDNARDFVIRVVPDLAYIASLPELIRKESNEANLRSPSFAKLSGCIREGLDCVEKLALFSLLRKSGARIACHKAWLKVSSWVVQPSPEEDWNGVFQRVKAGMAAAKSAEG